MTEQTNTDEAARRDGSTLEPPVGRPEPERAFARWRDLQPYGGATDRERAAFLAGFKAATEPLAPTNEELMSEVSKWLRDRHEREAARIAALLPGTCTACSGEGQQGGQFCGGLWTCEACGGTGKTPND